MENLRIVGGKDFFSKECFRETQTKSLFSGYATLKKR